MRKKRLAKARADPASRKVGDVMRRDFVTVPVHETVGEAIGMMRFARIRHLLVERDGVLAGLVSYRDLQDRLLDARMGAPQGALRAAADVAVEAVMVEVPYAISPDAPLAEAASRMCRFHIGCLPVVEASEAGPRLVGLVTEADLLRAAYLSN
jgi:CBS domain-containing protein